MQKVGTLLNLFDKTSVSGVQQEPSSALSSLNTSSPPSPLCSAGLEGEDDKAVFQRLSLPPTPSLTGMPGSATDLMLSPCHISCDGYEDFDVAEPRVTCRPLNGHGSHGGDLGSAHSAPSLKTMPSITAAEQQQQQPSTRLPRRRRRAPAPGEAPYAVPPPYNAHYPCAMLPSLACAALPVVRPKYETRTRHLRVVIKVLGNLHGRSHTLVCRGKES
jgi:hypothetical protein